MELKYGVKLTGLTPQMALAAMVVKSVCDQFNVPCVVTSGNDSRHGDGSLHHCKSGKYTDGLCRALDFRTKYPTLDGKEQIFRDTVASRLGIEFDVVQEAVGTDDEHLHVEYDPK